MSRDLSQRLIAIDALRGLVMVLMLLDHVRETFYLHLQLADPIDVTSTDPMLFINRTLAHLCAPVFVFLTGLSAALYHQKVQDRRQTALFLFQRGLILILLELTLVNFAWTFQFPPQVIYLQVIWAIGMSMLALSALIWLPAGLVFILGIVIVGGHNLLDSLQASAGSIWSIPWAILHDRGWIDIGDTFRMRTSYPVLPWIGVISLGYVAGALYRKEVFPLQRQKVLLTLAGITLALFFVLRSINLYGEKPWQQGDVITQTLMSYFNITKYPPSLLFLCLTLSIGLCLLAVFERQQQRRWLVILASFGAAPMFFYLLHLYVLKGMYLTAVAIWGKNQGEWFGFSAVWQLWVCTLVLMVVLFLPVRAFARLKARRRDIRWLKYF
ncbi:DUF1624 domain-containing protein [Pectobacterium brasiliense]|uniref:DUF1624 domain-containing protein n=1 Tax=Pectobacterium brasiliense TaxID=180957 RepID=UPI0015DF66D2|nr:heparan-alpha-glucosaminide N-acetyltransferase domain-containing protein [Pectobacterium brasiliense]MBA0197649.1 DUF1624 domain-containing protein [Pectobacterium brasiliense]MBN3093464.1 DUF1624 domain-containing protein [Pectobacterium brasiliense]MBN3140887.1 DUF1624 domain-containing protein [Pectobacterium brasiliense]MBW5896624.1 DUF1624 domain-containing protein [Pectobacterium brasiliense]